MPTHTIDRVGRRHRDVADRRDLLVVEDGLAGGAVVHRLPDAARGGAHVEGGGPALHDREVVDAAAHDRGADVAEGEPAEQVRRGRRWRAGGDGLSCGTLEARGGAAAIAEAAPETTTKARRERRVEAFMTPEAIRRAAGKSTQRGVDAGGALQLVARKDAAALDHLARGLQDAEVGGGIAVEDEQVGELAAASVPRSASRPITRAPPRVAALRTWAGVSPASTISRSSRWMEGPCRVPMLPASVPAAMRAPAAASRRRLAQGPVASAARPRWPGPGA